MKIEKLTKELKEYICNNICQYPSICRHEEHLMEVCEQCQIEEYMDDIQKFLEKVGEHNG